MTKKFYIELGKALQKARENAGMTQQMVSNRLGVSRSAIANWEQGRRNIYIEQFVKMCEIYSVNPDDILIDLRRHLYSK